MGTWVHGYCLCVHRLVTYQTLRRIPKLALSYVICIETRFLTKALQISAITFDRVFW